MLELPEVIVLSGQIGASLAGKTVRSVHPPTKPHKFTWFGGDPAGYHERLAGARILGGEGFGSHAEIVFDNGLRLDFSDGASVRLYEDRSGSPSDYQLLIEFSGGGVLAVTIAMYGGIVLHGEPYDNPYYQASKSSVSPLDAAFGEHFRGVFAGSKPTLSTKAFLATEQRFPGVGNGVLQDILLAARVHPKRKIGTLSAQEQEHLLSAVTETLTQMAAHGGRDTEKGLYGNPGGYRTMLSKNTLATGCPLCGGAIIKEAYMGGAVYYCPACQPLP